MHLELSADELLMTTRSVRKRLDLDRPVDTETVMECLDIALQAPTGSNRQGWQWVFVADDDKKAALARIYRDNFTKYRSRPAPQYDDGDVRAERRAAVMDSATYLAEEFQRVPVMMIPCIEGRADPATPGAGASFWGSLLPAVWSFMLALRERGMGSAWTTLHLLDDGERQAAELLGIPHERYSQAGLFPIAHTIGTDFKPASRLPGIELSHWDTWGERPTI